MSSYDPPQETRQFYQREYSNILSEDVPRRLQPVELSYS